MSANVNVNAVDGPTRQAISDSLRFVQALLNMVAVAASPSRFPAGRGAVSHPLRGTEKSFTNDTHRRYLELVECLQALEESGDPETARRIAELFEATRHFDRARPWWHRAAELGDPDAIDYVDVVLAG